MYTKMLIFVLFQVFLGCNNVSSQERARWIDPHSMNMKYLSSSSPHLTNAKDTPSVSECSQTINFSSQHYKRLLSLLLRLLVIETSNGSRYKGYLNLDISLEDYKFLKSYIGKPENAEDAAALRQIDHILSKTLTKPRHERLAQLLITWTDNIYFTFYNRTAAIISIGILILFISYKLLKANLTVSNVMKYILFIGWIADYAFTWINLLQEAEINKLVDGKIYQSMPPQCDPQKMSIWQYAKYYLTSSEDCQKYYQVLYKETFWDIAPLTIFSRQFGIVIYTPATYIGQALGSLSSGILDKLPWGVNIILLPILLIFLAIIICIIFSYLTKTNFSVNLFHVINLKFGTNERQAFGDMLSGRNLTTLLNIQRNMIEDVNENKTSSKERKGKKSKSLTEDEQQAAIEPQTSVEKESLSETINSDEN